MVAKRKNILLILVDQLRFPQFSYGADFGFAQPIKRITGFQEPGDAGMLDPAWAEKYFPAMWSLRKHAVILRRHYIASSACTPSRAVMMTGQYGTRTGVTQTDGTFKNGDSPAFPWLAPNGIPTIGSWMREAGYNTHYFGKWHVSNPPEHNLQRYGFDDWDLSYPEPHGSLLNNLGIYRDYQFADLCSSFLRRQGLGLGFSRFVSEKNAQDPLAAIAYRAHDAGYGPTRECQDHVSAAPSQEKPWFATVSFANPHDIATYPSLPRNMVSRKNFCDDQAYLDYLASPLGVPNEGWISSPPDHGTMQFALNLLGFPQGKDAANIPPTLFEDLKTKPRCQYDYAYKMGLTLASKLGWSIALANANGGETLPALWAEAAKAMKLSGLPFQEQKKPHEPKDWALAFIRFYAYLVHTADQHIAKVLTALRESGQEDNTVVLFMADHGEYGGAHGMLMEKWHTAYQEALHVPFLVRSSSINPDPNMKQCDALTSHVDLLPTILGLAGIDASQREQIRTKLQIHHNVPEIVGSDLAPLIAAVGARKTVEPTGDEPVFASDGSERKGVLFITDDEITAPLLNQMKGDPHSFKNENEYAAYQIAVKELRTKQCKEKERPIFEGSVIQPNHIRSVITAGYKLARYWDPTGKASDEWEMYDLKNDLNEVFNLLVFDGPFPTVANDLPPWAKSATEIKEQAYALAKTLSDLVKSML